MEQKGQGTAAAAARRYGKQPPQQRLILSAHNVREPKQGNAANACCQCMCLMHTVCCTYQHEQKRQETAALRSSRDVASSA
jgi:hypothetical protein